MKKQCIARIHVDEIALLSWETRTTGHSTFVALVRRGKPSRRATPARRKNLLCDERRPTQTFFEYSGL